jgi:hypothetical protein
MQWQIFKVGVVMDLQEFTTMVRGIEIAHGISINHENPAYLNGMSDGVAAYLASLSDATIMKSQVGSLSLEVEEMIKACNESAER